MAADDANAAADMAELEMDQVAPELAARAAPLTHWATPALSADA